MSRYSNRTLGHKRKQIHDPEELEKKLGDGQPGAGVDALGGGGWLKSWGLGMLKR